KLHVLALQPEFVRGVTGAELPTELAKCAREEPPNPRFGRRRCPARYPGQLAVPLLCGDVSIPGRTREGREAPHSGCCVRAANGVFGGRPTGRKECDQDDGASPSKVGPGPDHCQPPALAHLPPTQASAFASAIPPLRSRCDAWPPGAPMPGSRVPGSDVLGESELQGQGEIPPAPPPYPDPGPRSGLLAGKENWPTLSTRRPSCRR